MYKITKLSSRLLSTMSSYISTGRSTRPSLRVVSAVVHYLRSIAPWQGGNNRPTDVDNSFSNSLDLTHSDFIHIWLITQNNRRLLSLLILWFIPRLYGLRRNPANLLVSQCEQLGPSRIHQNGDRPMDRPSHTMQRVQSWTTIVSVWWYGWIIW